MTSPSDDAVAGRYVLGDTLGRGGMAEVRRARDLVLDRDVAMKILHDVVDEADRRRFLSEAGLLARLSHVALVTVLDVGTMGDRPFLVMELVEGRTLADALRGGPMSLEEVRRIGVQLAEALEHAHSQGVVHRDVKPANVLLGNDGEVKLTDFGIARLVGDAVRHTKTGTLVGTAAYLAPEQVRGQDVGGPADVYSLGLVLLEALRGERVFAGTPTEAAVARLHSQPEAPTSLPPSWRTLLTSMTALDADQRPSAKEVAERLGALRVDDATLIMPAEVSEAATVRTGLPGPGAGDGSSAGAGPGRRSRLAVLAVLGVVCVVVLLAAVGIAGLRGEEAADDELPPEVPTQLRSPLQDLHDAVHGRAS